MSPYFSLMRRPFSRFLRDEGASVVAEAVIVLPLLLWAYIALFVYWDAFRSMNTVQKAAYTLSDMISRDQNRNGITSAYIDGMKQVMNYLIDENQDPHLRVSSIYWSNTNNRFEVQWSRSPNNQMTPMTTALLQGYSNAIPTMAAGDTVILVETEVDYVPAFNVGMPNQVFRQFIVTRPRFRTCILMDGQVGCPIS